MSASEVAYVLYLSFIFLVKGIPVTLAVTAASISIGFALGLSMAIARVFIGFPISGLVEAYEKFFRGVPDLVIIFLIYFGLPALTGRPIAPFPAISLALGLRSAAYQSQIFRGALEAVTRDQMDAALSVGMRVHQAITHIILPQALRISLPGWASEFAVVIKDSSYAFLLGLMDLMRSAELLRASLLAMGLIEYLIIPYAIAALIYFAFTFPISRYLASWAVRKRVELGL